MTIKILSQQDIKTSVDMPQAIAAVRMAFIQLSRGEARVPQRIQVPVETQQGTSLFMPAYLALSNVLGAKVVSVFPRNPARGLPTIHAVVIVLSAETGRPEAVMDGTSLTALRTGAASGLATDLMARPDARTAALFGAGVQGRTQLEAVRSVRTLDRLWVYDKDPERASTLAEEYRGASPSFSVFVAETPSQAVREADIICTATTSAAPVFEDADLKPGAHINGIGSYTPEAQEIPAETVVRAKIVVDSLDACLEEAGDLIIPLKQGRLTKESIHGEIGQVAGGEIPGRTSAEEITFFKSVGIAVQDVAVADLVLRAAREQGLGTDVEI